MLQYLSKQELREKVKIFLKKQREKERLAKSKVIQEKLFKLPEFYKSATIFFYASFGEEVETFEMMKQAKVLGKKIGLPKIARNKNFFIPAFVEYLDHDLEDGPFGIKQPKEGCTQMSLEDIDLAVVPGVAFDKTNNRLGRGGGYYDRFLKQLPKDTPTIGLAFDFQVVDTLLQEEHDISVSCVITN
ncbi:5-formyltetrahydrofolate cyclo-ligase [hydrothermal vent metagenome]|uniref:5-formyltetrahydrofolate cyclo-ligase n=1 Tax=hydrothermal vent metagenome TaxID=652676 RepID=A0A3B1DYI1_9ZZZZ